MNAQPASRPKIVVGLPLYNERRYLGETLESLARQDHSHFRVLMADNASDDGSGDLCRAFAQRDPRFTHVRHDENRGAAYNFGYCLDASESDYFMWCGAHDVLPPDYLSRLAAALDGAPDASLAFGSRSAIDEASAPLAAMDDGRELYRFSRNRYLRYAQVACGLSDCTLVHGLFRRSALEGFRIEPIQSCDKVLLSHALFSGRLESVPGAVYGRRFFARRKSTHGERISGNRSGAGMDATSLVAYFAGDLRTCFAARGLPAGSWRERLVLRAIQARFDGRWGRAVRLLARLQIQPRRVLRALVHPGSAAGAEDTHA